MSASTCDACGGEVEEVDEDMYPLVVCDGCRDESNASKGRGDTSKTPTQTGKSRDERRIRPPEDW
jgi:hypothetical protein